MLRLLGLLLWELLCIRQRLLADAKINEEQGFKSPPLGKLLLGWGFDPTPITQFSILNSQLI
jgi:hypothetical protein